MALPDIIGWIVGGSALLIVAIMLLGLLGTIRDDKTGRGVAEAVRRMKDPVAGTISVTSISVPDFEARFVSARLTGVMSGDGVAPRAVEHKGMIATKKWPRPGQHLPVMIDRADPDRFVIEWFKVKTGSEAGLDEAERLASEMRAGGGGDAR